MREAAKSHKDIDFIAVSHSDQESTDNWMKALPQSGSETSNLKVVVDDKVEIYQAWGLGAASFFHVLSPFQLWNVYKVNSLQLTSVRRAILKENILVAEAPYRTCYCRARVKSCSSSPASTLTFSMG